MGGGKIKFSFGWSIPTSHGCHKAGRVMQYRPYCRGAFCHLLTPGTAPCSHCLQVQNCFRLLVALKLQGFLIHSWWVFKTLYTINLTLPNMLIFSLQLHNIGNFAKKNKSQESIYQMLQSQSESQSHEDPTENQVLTFSSLLWSSPNHACFLLTSCTFSLNTCSSIQQPHPWTSCNSLSLNKYGGLKKMINKAVWPWEIQMVIQLPW